MSVRIRAAYDRLVREARIDADPAQRRAVVALERLQQDLRRRGGFRLPFVPAPAPPRGLYLWGPPGRGKSMLMDLFFGLAPEPRKRRVHFHVFMAEAHALVALWREGDAAERRRRFGQVKGDDPIRPVAEAIAARARLLCFDELQVTDIADAMILGRLFEALFDRGVILVATSNRPPADLYRDGINRQLFLPFIAMLERRCETVEIQGSRDFRLDRLRGKRLWFAPADKAARAAFDDLWRAMTAETQEIGAHVDVLGRRLSFPRAAGPLLRAGFADLCAAALGPQDYLALAGRFHTLFLEDVPQLGPERRNEARRLVTLVDALYEARARLVVLAQTEPQQIYPAGDGAFEFERTASRLEEMRSADYVERSRDA